MALSTRKALEESIATWLNREDPETLNRIPDFITLAENRIFRRLRCRSNETLVSAPLVDSNIVEPADFLEAMQFIYGYALTGFPLTVKTRQAFYAASQAARTSGVPAYVSRVVTIFIGQSWRVWPPSADATQVYTLYYYQKQKLGPLDDNTTQVLVDAPGLYLFGALMEAAPFLKFKEDLPQWQQKYAEIYDELMTNTWESEYTGSTVEVTGTYGD
jgi:hypothetical protein